MPVRVTRKSGLVATIAFVAAALAFGLPGGRAAGDAPPDILLFAQAVSPDAATADAALERIAASWRDSYAAMIIDLARLMRPSRTAGSDDLAPEDDEGPEAEPSGMPGSGEVDPSAGGASALAEDEGSPVRRRLIRFLERQTGQRYGEDLDRWRRWLWSLPYEPHPDYAAFKRGVYGQLDPRFREFFPPGVAATVRLDQIDWGGVAVDGIPLLDHPRHVPAAEARFLRDKHVVFGIERNGESRAYPKRILAWHELARDALGGEELAIVYCTLCGAAIPYRATAGETTHRFRTSGLLYRSNKLMFDEGTLSLWSTIYGEPVVGPLVGSGARLERVPVVTTTWGEWRAAHPETTVLSLDTGFERDYAEGAAYRDYFRTDRLMFEVPAHDARLANKAEVLALRVPGPPLALAAQVLADNPLYAFEHEGARYVVVTSPGGANRVYAAGDRSWAARRDETHLTDDAGRVWRITEEALEPEDGEGAPAPRVDAHRVFWFAWYAHYPDTRLIEK